MLSSMILLHYNSTYMVLMLYICNYALIFSTISQHHDWTVQYYPTVPMWDQLYNRTKEGTLDSSSSKQILSYSIGQEIQVHSTVSQTIIASAYFYIKI